MHVWVDWSVVCSFLQSVLPAYLLPTRPSNGGRLDQPSETGEPSGHDAGDSWPDKLQPAHVALHSLSPHKFQLVILVCCRCPLL